MTTELPIYPDERPMFPSCMDLPRPCPYASCRHHMFELVKGDLGRFGGLRPDKLLTEEQADAFADILLDLPVTCFYDKWERGKEWSPRDIGKWVRVTGNMISNTTREKCFESDELLAKLRPLFEEFYNPDYDGYRPQEIEGS